MKYKKNPHIFGNGNIEKKHPLGECIDFRIFLKVKTKVGVAETSENAKGVVIQETSNNPGEDQKPKIELIL